MTQMKLNTWLWCMRIINLLTVYLVCKHFPINHPIGHVEDVLGQFPWWLLVGKQDGLPGDPKTHQHHQHNDDKVHHVYHLEGWESRGRNKRKPEWPSIPVVLTLKETFEGGALLRLLIRDVDIGSCVQVREHLVYWSQCLYKLVSNLKIIF